MCNAGCWNGNFPTLTAQIESRTAFKILVLCVFTNSNPQLPEEKDQCPYLFFSNKLIKSKLWKLAKN